MPLLKYAKRIGRLLSISMEKRFRSELPKNIQHVEALLRKKIESMKKELGSVRSENGRLKQALEKERGKAEHFRQNWINAQIKI